MVPALDLAAFVDAALERTSRCGHLSAVHLYRLVPAGAVWSFQNTRGSPSNVKVYGASLRSASNATGYQLRCQSKSAASESTGAAEAEAGGSTTAVGTSDAPRTVGLKRAPREAAGGPRSASSSSPLFRGGRPCDARDGGRGRRRRGARRATRGGGRDARGGAGARARRGRRGARGAKAGDASIDIFDGTGRW